jgi:hypothetical protein
MGGKRPDQHQLDPGEGRATDYKFRRRAEDDMHKQVDQRSGQPIPPTVPSPDANNPEPEGTGEGDDASGKS